MKKLFLFIFMLLAMTVAGVLSSCGNDDDEDERIYETCPMKPFPHPDDTQS